MKKLLTLVSVLAVAISLSMPVFGAEKAPVMGMHALEAAPLAMPAQETETKTTTTTTREGRKLMTLRGTVSDEGKTFTDDKDQKAWAVQNPEALKRDEGQHVRVRAHIYTDKGEIHVSSVRKLKKE